MKLVCSNNIFSLYKLYLILCNLSIPYNSVVAMEITGKLGKLIWLHVDNCITTIRSDGM